MTYISIIERQGIGQGRMSTLQSILLKLLQLKFGEPAAEY